MRTRHVRSRESCARNASHHGARGLRLRRDRHGAFDVDFSRLEALIGAGQAAGLATLVRPWGEDVGLIGKVLDIGANGIMASHVESPARARAIVEQARFAPRGNRGFSPLTKYDALGEPLRTLDDATYVVAQIEGRQALANIAAIATVPGVDAVFVGPYDLALSLGVPPGSPPGVCRRRKARRDRYRTASRSGSTSMTRRSAATGPRGVSRCNASASTGACWRTPPVRS